jgi:multisubunit Na+/H+ antiporter MnhB subunit
VNSLILSTATRILVPVILLLSVFVFLRGHNAPGGGFVGGLLAASAFALLEKAEGLAAARRRLHFRPQSIAAVGLGCALLSGLWGGLGAGAFLKGMWPFVSVDAAGNKHGLPLGSIPLFDLGVYLVVLGTVCAILFALEESIAGHARDGD